VNFVDTTAGTHYWLYCSWHWQQHHHCTVAMWQM